MTRIAPKLLTALFVLGCGSGAMAAPNRGQWTDNTGADQSQPPQGYPAQGSSPSQGYPAQGSSPSQGYPAQSGSQPPGSYPSQGYPSRGSYPSQGYPSQGGSQDQGPPPSQDQEQDEDTESETLEAGQGRLGVVVMVLTSELRQFFGVASDRGVLIARVEPSSSAARAGIQVGDVLVRVGPQAIHSGDDVLQALAARQNPRLRILVVRQGRPIHLVVIVPTASNNQPISSNNQPISSNNQPIPPNNQPFSSNNQPISSNNQPISSNNQPIPPNNPSIPPNNQSIPPSNQPVPPNNQPLGSSQSQL